MKSFIAGVRTIKGRKGITVQQRGAGWWVIVLMSLTFGMVQTLWAEPMGKGQVIPVQVPYEAPPKGQHLPAESVPQNTKPLTAEETQRAEALLPLLEGKQEFLRSKCFQYDKPFKTCKFFIPWFR